MTEMTELRNEQCRIGRLESGPEMSLDEREVDQRESVSFAFEPVAGQRPREGFTAPPIEQSAQLVEIEGAVYVDVMDSSIHLCSIDVGIK